MTTTAISRLWIFGVLCLGLYATGDANAETPGTRGSAEAQRIDDDREMGARRSGGAAWAELDPKLRAEFATAYGRIKGDQDRPVFEKYLKTVGAAAMIDYLEITNRHCHSEAHNLGKTIYAHTQDVNRALRECGNGCTNGCMHGVVSEAFGGALHQEVTQQMIDFCGQGEMARLHKPGNCAHGIGHALMINSGHDLGKSLDACKRFPKAGMDYYCATGVFMEYQTTERDKAERGDAKPRPTFHFPCNEFTQYPAACYRYMMRTMEAETGADPKTFVKECLTLSGRLRRGCFHGLGSLYTREISIEPQRIKEICLNGGKDDQVMCIEGAIEKLADYNEKEALVACAQLSGANEKVCLAAAKGKMYRLDKPTMSLYR